MDKLKSAGNAELDHHEKVRPPEGLQERLIAFLIQYPDKLEDFLGGRISLE